MQGDGPNSGIKRKKSFYDQQKKKAPRHEGGPGGGRGGAGGGGGDEGGGGGPSSQQQAILQARRSLPIASARPKSVPSKCFMLKKFCSNNFFHLLDSYSIFMTGFL